MSETTKEHLTTIYERHHSLTPALVVDESRDPDAPLHNRFEWDDTTAGEAYRRTQAAALIRSVHIKFTAKPDSGTPELKVRAFVSLREDGEYLPSEEVAESPEMTATALGVMEMEWRQLRRRYQAHAEFWALIQGDTQQREAS
jgi:hypothetical protein